MVASLLTWWAQAAPTARPRLAAAWLRASRVLAADTPEPAGAVVDTTGPYKPSRRPRVRPQDRPGSPFGVRRRESPLVLPLPGNVKLNVTVDDSLKQVDVQEKVGTAIDYRDPSVLTYEEFAEYQQRESIRDYYRQKAKGGIVGAPAAAGTPQAQRLIPKIYLGPVANRIFGGSYVDIRPAGSVALKFGGRYNKNENPALTLRQQGVGDFLFEQNINVNLTGAIGTKLKLVFNYDTKASFDFDNQMKFDYAGEETDIIRKVDLGNVSLPLNNSLVQGGQNLFGIKTQLQFGKLGVTAVAATVRGTADEVRIQNGAQSRQYEIKASQYERDRHFFLSQFFRERYDQALRNLPTIQSGVSITRVEVYVTNDNRTTENLRNVVTLMDLAEPLRISQAQRFPGPPNATPQTPTDNKANTEFSTLLSGAGSTRDNLGVDAFLQNAQGLTKNVDFERVRARKLGNGEFTFNPQLGYISLNTPLLPDQVLGVSYTYIYNGKTYKVGELTDDYTNVKEDEVVFLKMLRASNPGVGVLPTPRPDPLNPGLTTRNTPTWDLMMKNIYPLNASQLQRDNFQLQLIYKDDETGVDLISLKEGTKIANRPLIEVLNLDNVNPNNDRNPDGNFDFFPGITIDPELGRIIFPNVQPFGSFLRTQFEPTETGLIDKYVYSELYDQTQSDAQQRQEKDKFFLRGRFQGGAGSDEINLPGIGIAQGSVRVRSGSTLLTEGVDYQVFYDQAKVKILNPAYLNSANELRVEFEKNALVQVQPRRMLGVRLDYRLNNDVNIGGTALHLLENQAPGINRVNIGDEPGNNTIIGLDGSIRKDSRVLTKYLDMLPFISTKEISTIAFSGEFAKLLPGQSRLGNGEDGVSYIDDFENARTPYTLGGLASIPAWRLAATPRTIADPVSVVGLPYNYQRAKLAWYTVDQSYYTGGANAPDNINGADLKNHYTRGIERDEVFPNKDLGATGNGYEYTFDMAYFPNERGPYNYNPSIAASGQEFAGAEASDVGLRNKFGGISRAITFDTDFDNSNIEYLEFWMMDPFLTGENGVVKGGVRNGVATAGNNTTGGDLLINLGNVSEDVLRDGNQHEFENGLPTSDDPEEIDNNSNATPYGRVTTQQFLTDAFNATPGARQRQDVGLDGVNNAAEQVQATAPNGYGAAYANLPDPSADDFRHHLDPSYNQANAGIQDRYKNYNGYENNSPENSQLSSTAYPDKEDLNRDNVVQEVERYYEYKISLRPNTVPGGGLEVGQNFIIDKITTKNSRTSNEDVTWYQFRIPVREGYTLRGATQEFGFKNIRFLRMYMTGWQQPVVLRLVQPQFVANQWRRFLYRVVDARQGPIPPVGSLTDADAFNISTVSLEENGLAVTATPGKIPYVSPPGIRRDKEYGSSATSRLQNEQSLRLSVTNLRDGYAKAAYKNITINMLRYKRLRMFLHGDSPDPDLSGRDVQAFLRIGTDYTQNYYQYSLPLQMTQPGETSPDQVWPLANRVDVAFQDFIDAKSERNKQPGNNFQIPYTKTLANGATITVVGNPDFSAVQGVMLGILNPTSDGSVPSTSAITANMWANELRVSDFEQQAGYAATARLNVKMADVANITATGSFTSVGFGGLQDKAQQRSIDDVFRGDLQATVAADKFLPERLQLRVPVLLQLGHESRAPLYDPLDPDTKLDQSLEKFTNGTSAENSATQAEYRKKVIDQTTSRSISVLNVRKERGPGKPGAPITQPKPWDIENVALSYSLTERLHTDIRTDRDYSKSYTGAVAYVYQTTPKNYTPLSKIKALDNPYLKIFQEINFTPLPSRFSFRTDIDRRYNERFLQRVLEPGNLPSSNGIAPVIQKAFFISRIYDLKWDLTKSLIFDYTANNRGVVDEGRGRTIGDSDEAIRNRSLLEQNLLRGGRTTNFNQVAALTYRLPLDKFPLTDWLSADTRYSASYTWQASSASQRAPLFPVPNGDEARDTLTYELKLGNTVQNNAELSANGKIDLVKLYNKVKFLNIINNAPPPSARAQNTRAPQPGRPELEGGRPSAEALPDSLREKNRFVKAVLRSLMTARSLNFTYVRTNGTLLPGYLPKTYLFGLDHDLSAPGIPFILGKQYGLNSLYEQARDNRWYTDSSQYLNTAFSSLRTEILTLRTALEPFRGFNIQVDARRQLARNQEVYYRNEIDTVKLTAYRDPLTGGTRLANNPLLGTGSFSTSTITIQTLFGDLGANGETSKAFQRFVDNRAIVRQRLAQANPLASPAPGVSAETGYGYNSQEVLVQSFIDAYHGRSSDGYKAKKFDPFAMLPLPNWTIQYNGFSDLPFVKKYFNSFAFNHAYSSVYSVGSYATATQYNSSSFNPDRDFPNLTNASGQFIPYYILGQVSIVERLAPLIGVNFQTVSRATGLLEYRTDRAVVLNTSNAQVTELYTKEIIIGFGYATNSFRLPFKVNGEQRVLKNNLTARLDLSIRDNITVQRSILDVEDIGNPRGLDPNAGRAESQVTNGSKTFQLRPTVDYLLNTRLNLQLYYSQTITTPRISNAFRNSTTEGGVLLRYSLTQ